MRCNIFPVEMISDQHLIAERRELCMPSALLHSKLIKGNTYPSIITSIPSNLSMGKGYITFWINKLAYLESRYNQITHEMHLRGFSPDPKLKCIRIEKLDYTLFYNQWTPCINDLVITRNRIADRLKTPPTCNFYKWRRRSADADKLIGLMDNYIKEQRSK